MKVYQHCPPGLGKGIHRVVEALERHAPEGVVFVEQARLADFVIAHVVGVSNFCETPIDELLKTWDKPYAIVQYCIRTTEKPTTAFWLPLWRGARLVWSYYDLDRFTFDEAGCTFPNFYYAPLGCDPAVFKPPVAESALFEAGPLAAGKLFEIGTSGFVAETEGVYEARNAVAQVRGAMLHLGPDLKLGSRVACVHGVSDETLARLWAECRYVAGLRRVEGFELPAVEGLFCGARPVCFDQPHYAEWFKGLAEYIPEGSAETVTAALRDLFRGPYRPVTLEELTKAHQRFNWPSIVAGFWERVHV